MEKYREYRIYKKRNRFYWYVVTQVDSHIQHHSCMVDVDGVVDTLDRAVKRVTEVVDAHDWPRAPLTVCPWGVSAIAALHLGFVGK